MTDDLISHLFEKYFDILLTLHTSLSYSTQSWWTELHIKYTSVVAENFSRYLKHSIRNEFDDFAFTS